ncbi:sugar kinase [Gilvimarinus agarilyticus]|uniref:sugar kinase n=1 Tax=Gilvimarinus sp. 2_MG-2023 TaxID=3062666 RepID=UPI001C08754A|nr:sugar kinase [Gilvimarinus sp. 2_MG-2023]MBU2886709.1 sugar kinase [Gilvimarinus agarilyticus]MDO6571375.1 sugar kinase [Gilvimarinus sp. 2_MG-2023]
MKSKIVAFGECMLELSQTGSQDYRLAYGGDTLNSAVYMARAGADVSYFTALGDDTYSEYLINAWRSEGINTDLVLRYQGEVPGLYIIDTDDEGERSFEYWRSSAPVRAIIKRSPDALNGLYEFNYLYLSGITLSLFDGLDRAVITEFVREFRNRGGVVAFDTNYRAKGWRSKQQAQEVISTFLTLVDIALPSLDDDKELFELEGVEACAAKYRNLGVGEVIIKDGKSGCYALIGNELHHHPLTNIVRPVDTTSAGDSFNGAYLAARSKNASVAQAIRHGQECATVVIQHPGAIIDRKIQ